MRAKHGLISIEEGRKAWHRLNISFVYSVLV